VSETGVEERLTPAQFKAIIKAKNWKYTELAERWGYTAVWVSNIARDPRRHARYDDMVMGLPNRKTIDRTLRHRQERAAKLVPNQVKEERKPTGEYRYHSYLTVNTIVVAATDVGSMAEEGTRGIVFQVVNTGQGERYGVIFETGLWDWFAPDHVDDFLVSTGLSCGNIFYDFQGEMKLQQDFAAGYFVFWPVS
jgi:hypothetical protein